MFNKVEKLNKETVREEANRRNISISEVRKERQRDVTLQPVSTLNLEIGHFYLDGLGTIQEIIAVSPDMRYIAKSGLTYNNKGLYSTPDHVHLKPFNLIKEI